MKCTILNFRYDYCCELYKEYKTDWASNTHKRKMIQIYFMFEFLCIISLYYIKNQQDATLAVIFTSNCKITLHVSDASCVHHQEY